MSVHSMVTLAYTGRQGSARLACCSQSMLAWKQRSFHIKSSGIITLTETLRHYVQPLRRHVYKHVTVIGISKLGLRAHAAPSLLGVRAQPPPARPTDALTRAGPAAAAPIRASMNAYSCNVCFLSLCYRALGWAAFSHYASHTRALSSRHAPPLSAQSCVSTTHLPRPLLLQQCYQSNI